MILIGLARLGRDAEVRYTPNGDPVASLSLAFDYGRKDQDGRRQTQWVEASLWGERADKLAQYLTKGKLLFVTLGDVHVETYEKRDNAGTGAKLVARVESIEFAGGRDDQAGGGERQAAPAQQRRPAAPAPAPAAQRPPFPQGRQQRQAPPPMDDDPPF